MRNAAYRLLLVWLLWAGTAITILMGMYVETDVVTFIRSDPSGLSWAIIGLFLVGVFLSFLLTMRLTQELVDVQEMEVQAREHGLLGIRTEGRKRAGARFFESVKSVADNNASPNMETLLHVELSLYQRVSNAIAVMGNLLITQGLIGTVVGLTITLSGLSGTLDALGHDETLLLEGLRKAMSGMGTAFYTTLMGAVFGGLVVRVFALITEGGVEQLQDRLTRICLVHCAADIKTGPDREVRLFNADIQALGGNVQALTQALEESRAAMLAFREEAARLSDFGDGLGQGDDLTALKEAIRMQQHYRILLRQEIRLVDKINRAWYAPLRKLFERSAKARRAIDRDRPHV